MLLFPSDTPRTLGFERIVARLTGYAVGELGRERLQALVPRDREYASLWLARTSEYQQVLLSGSAPSLFPLPDVREALRMAQPRDAVLDGSQLYEIASLLATWERVSSWARSARESAPETSRLLSEQEPPAELRRQLERIVDNQGQVRDDASPELQRLSRTIAQSQEMLRAALNRALREAAKQGYTAEEQPTIRSGRAVIPVRAEARRKVPGFVHDVSGSGHTVYIEPVAVLELNNEVRELELEHSREVRRLLKEATTQVRIHIEEIRRGLEILAQLDELQARARLANELEALAPELNTEGKLTIVNGRNPALMLHFIEENSYREVVQLHVELSPDIRTIVITGPNAGGKSVALKTVGLFAIMAACGLPVPSAPGTSIPVFGSLFVDIGDQQSIEDDLSTFTSRLVNHGKMLAEADEQSLVLIDEAGTGTDPAEGGALAQAMIEILTDRGAKTIATTHHGMLKAYAHNAPHVMNASMQFDQSTLSPTYRFLPNVPGASYAFDIAHRAGIPEEILNRARELLGKREVSLEELIADLEARSLDLDSRLAKLETERSEAEQARKNFEKRSDKLTEQREALIRKAEAEAREIVSGANAAIEQAIREIRETDAEREATRAARRKVEEVRQKLAKPEKKPKPSRVRQPQTGPIQVGDQVRLDNGDAHGEVLEISNREAVVAMGAMRSRVALNRLEKIGGPRKQQVEIRGTRPSAGLESIQMNLDVRGKRAADAVDRVQRFVDDAVAGGLHTVEILHGTGTGALRQAIREYLQTRPDVESFGDAEWNRGASGVTTVILN